MMYLRTALLGGLLLCTAAQAAPQHALTLYNEPPKYPADFKHFDYVNPDAPKGGTFRESSMGGFDSLNPYISKGVPADNLGLIYDTLAMQSLDEPITEYGLVAGKIEKAPDNSWVRFYPRPEARFHDGHPIRAEDVVFTFQTLLKEGSPIYRTYYADVDEVVAEDPLRVLFKFKRTNNRELPLILGQLPVLPKHWWATRDFAKGNLEVPLGSGPYQVAEVKAGRMIRTQQREAYQLLQEAGWRIVDDKMVDTTGKPVTIEFLLAQTEFERILLPFKRNLADLGIDLVIRRVDVSQFVNRIRSRDFDMLVGSFPQSTSPGNEQREFWSSSSADKPGSRNYMGLKDPAVDQLVEELIDADSRQSLVAHAKALDRVLQFGYYVIPNWHIKTYRVAYWDHLGHPKVSPRYDVGTATWWAKPDAKPAVTVDTTQTADPASGGD